MLKLTVDCPKDLDVFDIAGDLHAELKDFSNKIDHKLWLFFKKEYGQKEGYYKKIREVQNKPNECTYLANTGHISFSRLVENPKEATSQKGVRRKDRKQVRIVRGRGKKLLPKRYFKGKFGVHIRGSKWYVKNEQTIYDFLYEKADEVTERLTSD